MATWPEILPGPVEYEFTLRERRRREAQADDPPSFRKFASDAIVDARARWRFTPDHLYVFDQWWIYDANRGLMWFDIELPGNGGRVVRWARFIGAPTVSHLQVGVFDVAAQLEVRTVGGGYSPV